MLRKPHVQLIVGQRHERIVPYGISKDTEKNTCLRKFK